jgi:hypothetical protein
MRELISTGPWLPCPQEPPIVIPLVPALCPCGGRGFVPPVNRLTYQDTAQVIQTDCSGLWTLTRTDDVWRTLRSAVGPVCTRPSRCDYP